VNPDSHQLVALIGDVHGNLPALESVLEDARSRGAHTIWNAGDFLGYGAFPDEVVKILHDQEALSILGNYDEKVLRLETGEREWLDKKIPEKRIAFQWAWNNLSEQSRAFLKSLPKERRFEAGGRNILITHASPAADDELITLETPDSRLAELAKIARTDIVIFGHSHVPQVRVVAGVTFINPGSVGRSGDGDPRASYALYRVDAGQPADEVELIRLDYPIGKAVEGIRRHHLPEAFAQMAVLGLDVEAVLEEWADSTAGSLEVAGGGTNDSRLVHALQLARLHDYEKSHTHQVHRLSVMLFTALQTLHGYGPRELFLLECGALLHDIGWSVGPKGHHKSALRIILTSPLLPFTDRERQIVASIARYHRKALPALKHGHFAALRKKDRRLVRTLAGILRVADGLDRTHQDVVQSLVCEITERRIVVRCEVRMPADTEIWYALRKGQLLEEAFGRELAVECASG
jgi:putative phosphoesterase